MVKLSIYNKKIVYRGIVKDSNTNTSTTTKYDVYCKTEITYFTYDPKSNGKVLAKLVRTDFTILNGYENLSTLQINFLATSIARFDENANEVGTGTEEATGTVFKVTSNGLYTQNTTTKYYYGTYSTNYSIVITIKLTYKSTATSIPANNPYEYKLKI